MHIRTNQNKNMKYLIKRIDKDPKKCKQVEIDYPSIKSAIAATKTTSETLFMYCHVLDRSTFEVWKDGKLMASIQTDLAGFLPKTTVIKHKYVNSSNIRIC